MTASPGRFSRRAMSAWPEVRSSTLMPTENPAVLAASSMPRSVAAAPYRAVSEVRTVTERTGPPASAWASRLGR